MQFAKRVIYFIGVVLLFASGCGRKQAIPDIPVCDSPEQGAYLPNTPSVDTTNKSVVDCVFSAENIDFKTACDLTIQELKELPYVADLQVEVNAEEKHVRFIAVIMERDYPHIVVSSDYAELFVRTFHHYVEDQMPALKSSNEKYYGELFDSFEIRMTVFPLSSWYINDEVTLGTHSRFSVSIYGGGW